MAFWTYCCKWPQVYRTAATYEFPNIKEPSGGAGNAQLDGSPKSAYRYQERGNFYSIDNEGDWICLSERAGIQRDGTLWCWIPQVVNIKAFQYGSTTGENTFSSTPLNFYQSQNPAFPPEMPVKISEDTDWKFVTSDENHGFAIKNDGSLWAFGLEAYGCLGVGLSKYDPYYGVRTNEYRAKLSCSIKEVVVSGGIYAKFSAKPSVELRFYVDYYNNPDSRRDSELGTGATLEVDWTGSVANSDVTLTSGGSGYKSAPTVVLVPSSSEDNGKTLAGTVEMSQVNVESIDVVRGGVAYTYATATELATGAVATAEIDEFGSITAWAITSYGTKTVSLTNPQGVSVKIEGDGNGATASVTLKTGNVVKVTFPDISMWTSKPTVSFTGGGGSGAAATVAKIFGFVNGVRVTNGGSGYTQTAGDLRYYYYNNFDNQGTGRIVPVFIRSNEDYLYEYPDQREVVGNASVVLNEGYVVGFAQTFGISPRPGLEKQSTGEMGPFELYLNPGQTNSISVDLISPYVSTVPLTVKARDQYGDNIFEKTGTHTGYKYPPFLRIKRSSPYISYTNKQFQYEVAAVADNACAATGNGTSQVFHALKKTQFGSWPSGCGDVTATGETGATLKLVNIDGEMKTSERTWVAGYPPSGWYGYVNESAAGITVSQEPTPFTGPVFSETANIDAYQYYLSTQWVPWSIGETIRIYVEPSNISGDVPYGEASPGSDRVALPPVMVKQGTGLYTEEPLCLSVTAIFEMPVRVLGGETWKSVAIEGDKTLGVTTSGKLYWWGLDAANGRRACPFPSPVGQGVVCDVTPAGGESEYKNKGLKDDNYYYGGGARASVGVPQHGVHNAGPPNLSNFNAATKQIAYTTDYQGNIVISSLDQKIVNNSLPAKNRWFAPPPDSLAKLYQASGIGYTAPPSVTVHAVGEPIVSVSSRLVGPTDFTDVKQGGYARTSSGQWLYAWYRGYYDGNYYTFLNWNWGLGSFGTSVYYAYTSVSTSRRTGGGYFSGYLSGNYYLDKDDIDKDTTVNTRTSVGTVIAGIAHINNGGSGYSSATATISYSELRPWVPVAETVNTEVTCSYSSGATTKVITKSVSTYTYSPSLTTKTTQATLSVAGVSGRIIPWSASVGAVVQPSVVVSGDGSGGQASIADAADYDTQWGTLIVQSPPGMSTELSSSLISFSGSGDVVLFPYRGLNASYAAPQYPDVFTSFAGASRARAGGDGSVWEIATDGYIGNKSSGGMAAARSFPLSLSLVSTGSGYDSPATAIVSQQPGVARAEVTFDAKVQAIGVVSQGSGYTAPPTITLQSVGAGTPGTATAVIAGPVDQVTVTNAGNGYRLPPRVVFSGTGISPSATCTINQYGGVEAVSISSGGRYRDAPPTVSFVPVVQVESLAISSGGDGYSVAPKVYVGGGGGSGAAATCRIRAKVIEIELISGGSGYSPEPEQGPEVTIVAGMGDGATATANVDADGVISSITLDDEGDFYQFPPTVYITGGGGTGAYAVAKIAGYVDLITLTSRGSEFVNPPEVYFYDGVDGSGASATATIAAVGGGTTATARLNGSLIFCKHNSDSSGLQNPPKVVVSASTNPSLTALNQRLAAGEIAAAEHEGLSAEYAASLKSAIVGKVTAVDVTDGGSGYRPKAAGWGSGPFEGPSLSNRPSVDEPRIVPQAYLTPTHCVSQPFGGNNFNTYGSPGISASKTFVSEAGVITQVTLDDSTKNLEFVKKPSVVFLDGIAATPYTCLTRCGAAITDATTVTVPSDPSSRDFRPARWSGDSYGGTKSATNGAGKEKNAVTVVCVNGGIQGFSPTDNSNTTYRNMALYDFTNGKWLYYDPVPTVVIEDEKGTGAAAAMATYTPVSEQMKGVLAYSNQNYSYVTIFPGFTITSPGSGYTVGARPRLVGGSPFCWKQDNKAEATATADGGMVTAISVTSQGKGYNNVPDVVIYDGGGKGATAVAKVVLGRITAIEVTSPGTDYKSNPKVAIIDRDVLFDRSDKGKLIQSEFDRQVTPYLNPYTAEYCVQRERVQNTIISHLDIIPKELSASFVPFFDDDGYVEDIHWNVGEWFRYRPLLAAPTVTATPVESTDLAEYTASIFSWSDVMSETCLKKQ